MTIDAALCSVVPIGVTSAAPPEWLHLLPAGEVRTQDGRGPYRVTDAQALIRASMAAGKLVLDENHATDLAAPKGLPAPAAGWIVQLQNRADGLWGRVDWTEAAKRAEAWRGYRGVSPVIVHDKAGAISAVLRASLTNTPNLTGLTALHQTDPDMQLRTKLLTLLGLPAGADDDRIAAEVERLVTASSGKAASAHAAVMAQGRDLALQASLYRDKLAKAGNTITHAVAVRAVQEGKHL